MVTLSIHHFIHHIILSSLPRTRKDILMTALVEKITSCGKEAAPSDSMRLLFDLLVFICGTINSVGVVAILKLTVRFITLAVSFSDVGSTYVVSGVVS
jgi:hypothetical protein